MSVTNLVGENRGLGQDGVDRQIVRELIEQKTPKVLVALPDGGADWRIHHAIFARGEVTPAAQAELRKLGGLAVTLEMLDSA